MEAQLNENRIDTRHVDVLDGLRAVAVLIVCWYHIWQQSWLTPILSGPVARLFGKNVISLDVLPRTGYIIVDFMLLLSAFLLFLPYARTMVEGGPVPDARPFYKKRFARIVPSYAFAVLLIFFGYAVPAGSFSSFSDGAFELFTNLTFTQMFFKRPYLFSRINGVLGTVCVEMQFYLVFPLIAKAFKKQPVLTYLGMVGVSELYIRGIALPDESLVRMLVNEFPAFLGVFANGMLFALLFVRMASRLTRTRALSIAGTALVFLSGYAVVQFLHGAAGARNVQVYQLECRYLFSLTLSVLLVSSTVAARWFRWLLSNRLMRFLSGISYNLYIWHQWLAVRLKGWRVPYWTGDTPPNLLGDLSWQKMYTLICFLAAFGAAILATYLIERPAAKAILKMNPILPQEDRKS